MDSGLAKRVSIIPTTEEYYRLFHDAAQRAKRSLLIAGWDFQPDLALLREENGDGEVERKCELGEFIKQLAEANPELEVRIIAWNYSMLLAGARGVLEQGEWVSSLPDNVKVEFDPADSAGGAHHHKIVVIDEELAFVGGTDLSVRRWDTKERPPKDPRRVDPVGNEYPPWHDVQMLLEGDAARVLSSYVREQWKSEAGESIPPVEPRNGAAETLWPDVDVEYEDVTVRFARTWPKDGEDGEIESDIEDLFLHLIRSAKDLIYIENQYFTHDDLIQELAQRLGDPDGPEVFVVLPASYRKSSEEMSFGVHRDRKAKALREADLYGRLTLVTPWALKEEGSEDDADVYVHSKLLIADDEAVVVGSANFADRSMNVDTEVVAMLSSKDGAPPQSIRNTRNRLLGIHCGMDADEVERRVREAGSLAAFVNGLDKDSGPTLRLLDAKDNAGPAVPMWLADPDKSLWKKWQVWVTLLLLLALCTLVVAIAMGW